jgi:hypothetical protein
MPPLRAVGGKFNVRIPGGDIEPAGALANLGADTGDIGKVPTVTVSDLGTLVFC